MCALTNVDSIDHWRWLSPSEQDNCWILGDPDVDHEQIMQSWVAELGTLDPALLVGLIIIFPCRLAIGIIGTSAIWDNSKWHWHSYSQVQAQVHPLRGSYSWQGWFTKTGLDHGSRAFFLAHVPPLELEFRSGKRPFLTECFHRIGLLSPLSQRRFD